MNGFCCPFDDAKVVSWHYPKEYKESKVEDYAILILDRDVGANTGFYGVKAHRPAELRNIECNIYGYPACINNQNPTYHCLWGMRGPVQVNQKGDLLYYAIDTSPGQSGSAIWYNHDDKYYIVGIHIQGSNVTNSGTFLHQERLQRILDWIRPHYQERLTSIQEQTDIKEFLKQVYEIRAEFFIEELNFSGAGVGDEDIMRLVGSELFNLKRLDLSDNSLGSELIAELSRANFTNLDYLDLSWSGMGDRGALALLEADFKSLNTLKLSGNKISRKIIEKLRKKIQEVII